MVGATRLLPEGRKPVRYPLGLLDKVLSSLAFLGESQVGAAPQQEMIVFEHKDLRGEESIALLGF